MNLKQMRAINRWSWIDGHENNNENKREYIYIYDFVGGRCSKMKQWITIAIQMCKFAL